MVKIATHDSSTGERPANFLSWLGIPFARTQSKTIAEQIEAGVRMFDLRIKKYKGEYRSGHGIFTTKRTFESILEQINEIPGGAYATITYEGKLTTEAEINDFKRTVAYFMNKYTNIIYGQVVVKYTDNDLKVDWLVVDNGDPRFARSRNHFKALNGRNWQSYIPIPWLWKKIYYPVPNFNDVIYTYVDFL